MFQFGLSSLVYVNWRWCLTCYVWLEIKGAEPLIQLYEILLKAPGVLGARFSGAGFRGCCIALVEAELAAEAASFVKAEYLKVQPQLATLINEDTAVLICESDGCARVI